MSIDSLLVLLLLAVSLIAVAAIVGNDARQAINRSRKIHLR
jgi:hypothetical protein